jgi:hypothetical protein
MNGLNKDRKTFEDESMRAFRLGIRCGKYLFSEPLREDVVGLGSCHGTQVRKVRERLRTQELAVGSNNQLSK